jgi:hypothetical protein
MKLPPIAMAGLLCLTTWLCAGTAFAQIDLSGNWAPHSNQDRRKAGHGPYPVDFAGIPLNKEGRAAALSFTAESVEELQRQCQAYLPQYIVTGPFGFRISAVHDPVSGATIGWTLTGSIDKVPMTIWTDGRPHPPALALHTYGGFTTGHWEGDTLVTNTTHIKDGALERNGPPASNQTTLTLFVSRHDDLLTVTGVIRDPVYLEGPWVLAKTWQLSPAGTADLTSMRCGPAEVIDELSDGNHTSSLLPGQNPSLNYMHERYNIPLDAALGGVATMFPDFRKQLDREYKPPSGYCTQFCCDENFGRAPFPVCHSIN